MPPLKLFSFFTHAEDTDCRENEKFDKEYKRLYFLPPGNPTSPKDPVILSIIPSKGNQNLRCSIRTSQTLLLFFRWVTILDDKEISITIAIKQRMKFSPPGKISEKIYGTHGRTIPDSSSLYTKLQKISVRQIKTRYDC